VYTGAPAYNGDLKGLSLGPQESNLTYIPNGGQKIGHCEEFLGINRYCITDG